MSETKKEPNKLPLRLDEVTGEMVTKSELKKRRKVREKAARKAEKVKARAEARALAEKDPKPKAQPKKPANTSRMELSLPPLSAVYSAIPEENRYAADQQPEIAAEHKAYLESLGASILTRFPPEPNGFLHLGHAKSMFINFGYAKMRGGKTYLRYDDTNPSKEEQVYIDSIQEMMTWLGHTPFTVTHTSSYFQRLYDIAEDLISRDLCYVDNQSKEELSHFREKKLDPPCRFRPVEESMRLFREMRMGLHAEGTITLRMKMNMQSPNPCMRDPIAYRIIYKPHPHTGDEWCIYPSYDFSHCLIDSFENITHSICTMEFNIRRESYDWLTQAAKVYLPMQWEFSRLNVTYNLMSKRRLLRLVNENKVSGWDDPRLLTLAGLRRRGYTPTAINTFCHVAGVSRGDQLIELSLLEHVLRLELDRDADRAMAVLNPLKLTFVDWSEEDPTVVKYPLHPKKPERGEIEVPFGPELYIEREDFQEEHNRLFRRLSPTQAVGLRYGPIVRVQEVIREGDSIVELKCTHQWGVQEGEKKPKAYVHWIADPMEAEVRLYDQLFMSPNPYETEGDWIEDLNPDSLVVTRGLIPRYFSQHPVGTTAQFERLGYFTVDQDSTPDAPVLNRVVALRGKK